VFWRVFLLFWFEEVFKCDIKMNNLECFAFVNVFVLKTQKTKTGKKIHKWSHIFLPFELLVKVAMVKSFFFW
jgi:hypothetical protein